MRRSATRLDRLLVIGAGPVGLAMADALRRRGLAFDHVDAGDGVGGLWRNGVYQGVHIVSSKRSTGYTDYPMPEHYPDFPSSTQMLRYLESFARDRGLAGNVELRKKVVRAVPLADESWQVKFDSGEQRVYKGVVVCNGHHWDKRLPDYPGRFTGTLIHSKDYEEPRQLLKAIPGLELIEMPHNRTNSICCGGGGGGNWLDGFAWERTHTRMSEWRVKEALDSGAQILAVCCPYETPRFEDALKSMGREKELVVKDIAELLADAIFG